MFSAGLPPRQLKCSSSGGSCKLRCTDHSLLLFMQRCVLLRRSLYLCWGSAWSSRIAGYTGHCFFILWCDQLLLQALVARRKSINSINVLCFGLVKLHVLPPFASLLLICLFIFEVEFCLSSLSVTLFTICLKFFFLHKLNPFIDCLSTRVILLFCD